MQSHYPARFVRDMTCTEAEWLRWLPRAVGDHPWTRAQQTAEVQLGAGSLSLRWQVLPPRVLGLVRLSRLQLAFAFEGVDEAQRQQFMRRFDLYTQRGGG